MSWHFPDNIFKKLSGQGGHDWVWSSLIHQNKKNDESPGKKNHVRTVMYSTFEKDFLMNSRGKGMKVRVDKSMGIVIVYYE